MRNEDSNKILCASIKDGFKWLHNIVEDEFAWNMTRTIWNFGARLICIGIDIPFSCLGIEGECSERRKGK